ncbi:MAG: response regulator transcription factor [Bradymonadia bacterium]
MQSTIVLVEDSRTVQRMVQIALAKQNLNIVMAKDAQGALSLVRDHSPAAALVDAALGGTDGYALCQQIKAQHPGAKVILLTGDSAPYDTARGAQVGVDGHVVKPFITQDLIDTVLTAITGQPDPDGRLFRAQFEAIPLARGGSTRSVRTGSMPAQAPQSSPTPAPATRKPAPPSPPPAPAPAPPAPAPAPAPPTIKPTPAPPAPPTPAPSNMANAVAAATDRVQGDPQLANALAGVSREVIERVVWEVVPPLAEAILKEEIARLIRERMGGVPL